MSIHLCLTVKNNLTVQVIGVVKECLTTGLKGKHPSQKLENPIAWLEPGATGNTLLRNIKPGQICPG